MAAQLPPLDLHAHINPKARPADLERLGAVVFAATRSLDEFEYVRNRRDQVTVWGVGCHPRVAQAQHGFDEDWFGSMLGSTAFVSEIGLDGRSKVSLEKQERVFASILKELQGAPRVASVHSAGSADRVLEALTHAPVKGAVLHWWRGDEAQTKRAIELGCWFSVNAAGLKHPRDVALIPLDRIFTETDHPSGDRASTLPRQPGSVGDVEQALARIYGIDTWAAREQVWANLAGLVDETNVEELLPTAVRRMIAFARTDGASG